MIDMDAVCRVNAPAGQTATTTAFQANLWVVPLKAVILPSGFWHQGQLRAALRNGVLRDLFHREWQTCLTQSVPVFIQPHNWYER